MSSSLILVIAGIAAVAAGARVVQYSRRRREVVRTLARRRGVPCVPRDDGSVEASLERRFGIADSGCARSFGQVRDIVALPEGTLLRMVELLDLNPYGSVQSPHNARVAMTFAAAPDVTGIFLVAPDLSIRQVHPLGHDDARGPLRVLLSGVGLPPPPHPLCLTLTGGHALAYLEPKVTGAVEEAHLEYLVDLATRLGDASLGEGRRAGW